MERILWTVLFIIFFTSLVRVLPQIMTKKGKFPYVKLKTVSPPKE